jgi:Bacterial aa3 type cytochrome c oxidase subunit IV
MATVTYEQRRRSYVDPRKEYPAPEDADFAAHVRTYRSFIRYTIIFAAHVAVILALMAYFLIG